MDEDNRSEKPRERRQDSRLEAILGTIVEGIITIDEKGIVQTFNAAAEKIFGYRAEEVVGRNVNMLMPEPYRSQHDTYIRNYLTTGEKRIIGIGREVAGRRKNGGIFPMELAVSEARVGGQRIFAGIIRDITDRRRAERERERLIAELEEKNAEMERFAYTVSHDLRTPLSPIIGYAELLREQYGDRLDEAGEEMLREIERQGERMLELIDDLLILARAGYIEPPEEPVDADDVVEGVLAEQGNLHAEGLEVRKGTLPAIHVPRTLLTQVFGNLIGNAVRYAGSDGSPIEIGGERVDNRVRYFVRDHGPGIPDRERTRIFDLFYRGTTGRGRPGSGVGLATVRKIAHAYGGRVWVEETPGGGSTFWVEMLDGAPLCLLPEKGVG